MKISLDIITVVAVAVVAVVVAVLHIVKKQEQQLSKSPNLPITLSSLLVVLATNIIVITTIIVIIIISIVIITLLSLSLFLSLFTPALTCKKYARRNNAMRRASSAIASVILRLITRSPPLPPAPSLPRLLLLPLLLSANTVVNISEMVMTMMGHVAWMRTWGSRGSSSKWQRDEHS